MKKKLIEVALPLEAINKESAREKSIRHGHPSTLHLWWARRPLAACRAVLFASLVDDPSQHPEQFPTEEEQTAERDRLFGIIEELVKWENTTNEEVLNRAREEILKSTGGNPPPVLDPFCGGGSIPLEAQRLGLEAHGSDLNPVAVLITKALIEIPPKFANCSPVHPDQEDRLIQGHWRGTHGLAEDVRYYGQWMRDEAEKRIGHLYPKVKITDEMVSERPDLMRYKGRELTVIAWLWARTVKCPNPACGAQMPLVRSFELSKKKGNRAWVEPIIDSENKTVNFEVKTGEGKSPEGTVKRQGSCCLVCGEPVQFNHIRSEGKEGRMSQRLMAIVTEGERNRVYLSSTNGHIQIAKNVTSNFEPDFPLPTNPRDFKTPNYGLKTYSSLFTPRQLTALTTFSDLVGEARERVKVDALKAGMKDDGVPLHQGGTGAEAYADAVAVYLAFALDKGANYWSTICGWHSGRDIIMSTFARQAIPMVWDYSEANPFSNSSGNFLAGISQCQVMLQKIPCNNFGQVKQFDSAEYFNWKKDLISTDPPYYDNIGYADLSDFFYVWLRKSLNDVFPELFSTLMVPKKQELVATPYRFEGDKNKAKAFFEDGLGKSFALMRQKHNSDFPMTVFYAFKQAESKMDEQGNGSVVSTGWETMLQGLLKSGFSITGTWPMRTELTSNLKKNVGALASSIVIVCRPRPEDAPITTRKDFLHQLHRELPQALKEMQKGNIAPVDMAQAAIGPGMAVFSRYSKVLEADGSPMSIRTALGLINQVLDEFLSEQESDYDPWTRWALTWFEQYSHNEGPFGDAETLATAKGIAVQGIVDAGIAQAKRGKVRLLTRDELLDSWDPKSDDRLTVWEVSQYLIRALLNEAVQGAARILAQTGGFAGAAHSLAYRLFNLCERKGWSHEALAYNSLVVSWPEIEKEARILAIESTRDKDQDLTGF